MVPLSLQLPFRLRLPTRCEWARGGRREPSFLDTIQGDRDAVHLRCTSLSIPCAGKLDSIHVLFSCGYT